MDVNDLIILMGGHTDENSKSEFKEQEGTDATGTSTAGSTTGYPTVTKWETGLARSVANTIDDKVSWKSLNKLVRGKGNTLI